MIINEETASPIIERLLLALVDDPRAVQLEANCLPGRVNWSFRVDVNDTGKVIGKGGTHLRAIQLIIELMGKAAREEWHAKPNDPTGKSRERRPDTEPPESHSPFSDCSLLGSLLALMRINTKVEATGNVADGFVFKIRCVQFQDHDALLDMHAAIYSRNQMEREPLNLIGALGSLFRSIGRRQGVRYRIDC